MKRLPVLGAAPAESSTEPVDAGERVPVSRSVLLAGGPLSEVVSCIVATASAAGARLRVLAAEQVADDAQLGCWLRAGAESARRVAPAAAAEQAYAVDVGDALTGVLLVGGELGQRCRASLSVFVGRAPESPHTWDVVLAEPSDALGVALGTALS